MNVLRRLRPALLLLGAVLATAASLAQPANDAPAADPKLPTLFLVGDLASSSQALAPLSALFDTAHLNLAASPSAGRTTRAYINSGDWEKLLARMKPGDFVLIEFAPAILSGGDKDAAIRTLQGIGDGTFDYLDPGTQKVELVHSYGWYLRRMVVDVIDHGASPILCSPPASGQTTAVTPTSAEPTAGDWSRAIAMEQRIPFVDLTAAGPTLDASALRAGLQALQSDPLQPFLKKP
jgi:hypothetical protein